MFPLKNSPRKGLNFSKYSFTMTSEWHIGFVNGLVPINLSNKPSSESVIIKIMWHSPENNFTASAAAAIWHNEFENYIFKLQCRAVITRSIFPKYSQRTPHSSPARARYGVYFVDPKSGWHSDAFPVIIHVICYNIRPRYNGTQLYCHI